VGRDGAVNFVDRHKLLSSLPPLPSEIDPALIEELNFTNRASRSAVRYNQPQPPGHEVWEYYDGDDEPTYVRDCTPEEIAEREAAYAKAYAEWRRNGGVVFTHGSAVYEMSLTLSDGRYYKLTGDGKTGWDIIGEGQAR
jgi:hypothetical protein